MHTSDFDTMDLNSHLQLPSTERWFVCVACLNCVRGANEFLQHKTVCLSAGKNSSVLLCPTTNRTSKIVTANDKTVLKNRITTTSQSLEKRVDPVDADTLGGVNTPVPILGPVNLGRQTSVSVLHEDENIRVSYSSNEKVSCSNCTTNSNTQSKQSVPKFQTCAK